MDEVKKLIGQCVDTSPYDFLGGRDIDAFVKRMMRLAEVVMHRRDGELAALISFYCNSQDKKVAYINMLCVSREYHRQGMADTLVEAAISVSKKRLFAHMKLHVHLKNHGALRLYDKHGFIQTDEYVDDKVAMLRKL